MVRSILHSSFTDKESFAKVYNFIIERTERTIHGNCVFSTLNYTKYIVSVILLFCTIYIFGLHCGKRKKKKKKKDYF